MSVRPSLWQLPQRFMLRLPVWVIVLLLSGLALLPRVSGLDDFYTTDEAYFWQDRVDRFSDALSMGDWAATNQTGHPGVTTMWLGSFGQRFAEMGGVAVATQGGGALFLAYLRTPLALINGLAVGLGYVLLRRLLPPRTALLAALLWATSPFLIAHSRLLHLDALLTSFTTLSLLSLCVATAPKPQRLLPLVVAGGCAGLALLTKAPALLLLPVTGLLLLIAEVRGKALTRQVVLAALGRASARFALWLAVVAVTFVALWPAMWVQPLASLGAVVAEVFSNGTQPHNAGNFFLGQPVADPGWAFYLAVIAWRGEAVTLVGLAALLISIGAALRRSAAASATQEQWVTAALTLFAVLFTLALTLLAKKFDRYLLPIWPVLQILGAVGLLKLLQALSNYNLVAPTRRALNAIGSVGLLALILLQPIFTRTYYLAAYNPLLGGGVAAQNVLLVGWGEGMEQVGSWLSARPDLRRGAVLSWLPPTLTPFVPAEVPVADLDLDTIVKPANYAVVYQSVAARATRTVAAAYAMQTPPLFTLRVQGVTYATVHQLPRPFTTSVDAVFSGLHLRGFSSQLLASTLTITPSWDVQVDRAGEVFSFLHVLNARGERVAQLDAVLDDGMFATWQAGQQFGTALPLTLPADLPPGMYQVVLGLYTQPDGVRLPLWHGSALPEQLAGPHAIRLFSFRVGPER